MGVGWGKIGGAGGGEGEEVGLIYKIRLFLKDNGREIFGKEASSVSKCLEPSFHSFRLHVTNTFSCSCVLSERHAKNNI